MQITNYKHQHSFSCSQHRAVRVGPFIAYFVVGYFSLAVEISRVTSNHTASFKVAKTEPVAKPVYNMQATHRQDLIFLENSVCSGTVCAGTVLSALHMLLHLMHSCSLRQVVIHHLILYVRRLRHRKQLAQVHTTTQWN